MQMLRTTITFPEPVLQQLNREAKKRGLNVSQVVTAMVGNVLKTDAKTQIKRYYASLLEGLAGIGPKGVKDASATINDLLYGAGPESVWHNHDRTS